MSRRAYRQGVRSLPCAGYRTISVGGTDNLNRTRKLLALCAVALAAPRSSPAAAMTTTVATRIRPPSCARPSARTRNYDSGVINIGLDGSVEGVGRGRRARRQHRGPVPVGRRGRAARAALDATANVQAERHPEAPGRRLLRLLGRPRARRRLACSSPTTTPPTRPATGSTRRSARCSRARAPPSETTQDPESARPVHQRARRTSRTRAPRRSRASPSSTSPAISTSPSLAEEAAAGDAAVPFDASQLEGLTSTVDVFVAEEDNTFRGIDLGFAAERRGGAARRRASTRSIHDLDRDLRRERGADDRGADRREPLDDAAPRAARHERGTRSRRRSSRSLRARPRGHAPRRGRRDPGARRLRAAPRRIRPVQECVGERHDFGRDHRVPEPVARTQ